MKRILRKVLHRVFDFLLSIHQQERDKAYYQKFDIHPTVRFWNLSLEGNLSIGAHTYLNDNCRIDSGPASRVIIGRHCAIGRWVHITSKTHDLSCPTTSESQTEILHDEQDTVLGDYVWV
ncbi:MAG: hypothetical protein OEY56_13030, partial [Cyclobacteriaceae bacterium]|nr:hypothetical protein [Cyclobacteriaceae bacterium]